MDRREVPRQTLIAHGLALDTGPAPWRVVGEVSPAGGGLLCVHAAYGCLLDGPAGAAPCDRYELDSATLEPVRRELACKSRAYVRDPRSAGAVLCAVPRAERDRSALDFEQLRAIGALAARVQAALGAPTAVRWALGADGGLVILGAARIGSGA